VARASKAEVAAHVLDLVERLRAERAEVGEAQRS
jgi:hypothetical protein